MINQEGIERVIQRMREADTEFITVDTVQQFTGASRDDVRAVLLRMGFSPRMTGA